MGLFDKKKKGRDDFDSPVEQVDLSAAGTTVTLTPDDDDDEDDAPAARAQATPAASPRLPGVAPAPARPVARAPVSTYGIDDAIQLMRTLPQENVELVVRVVKHTLESTRIDIGAIIDDASQKQQRIEARVQVLKDAIADLEREIQVRKKEIDELETDHRETTKVKERLILAEKLTSGKPDRESIPTPVPSRAPRRPTGELPVPRTKPPTAPPQPMQPVPASQPATVTGEGSGPMTAAGPSSSHTVVPKK
ncbi:MAG TPA: hypothetical protein VFU21_19655 [Kofleriaceae bacterium]|nr:hypothetical protein [Kofleriaceae bacterium]